MNTIAPIKTASRYGYSPTSRQVYHLKSQRRLKRMWSQKGEYVILTDDTGNRVRYYLDAPDLRPVGDPLASELVRPIPDYPDYVLTPYGAVWRVKGDRLRKPMLVGEHSRNGVDYVQIRNKFGKRHNHNVKTLVSRIWPEDE